MQQQQDSSGGEESWLEEQCHREINGQNDEYEREFVRVRDNNLSTVWGAFQDSATAVAQLYRGMFQSIGCIHASIHVFFLFIGCTYIHMTFNIHINASVCMCVCVCVHKNSFGRGY